jgi:hypothetical protein
MPKQRRVDSAILKIKLNIFILISRALFSFVIGNVRKEQINAEGNQPAPSPTWQVASRILGSQNHCYGYP